MTVWFGDARHSIIIWYFCGYFVVAGDVMGAGNGYDGNRGKSVQLQ